jgi:hypothetical protein
MDRLRKRAIEPDFVPILRRTHHRERRAPNAAGQKYLPIFIVIVPPFMLMGGKAKKSQGERDNGAIGIYRNILFAALALVGDRIGLRPAT